jgi:GMP synthase-like glutamine amidotransferase
MQRLAVLTPFEGDMPFTARHPDDGAKVAAALQRCRPGWQFDTWRVSEGHWPADLGTCDGLVITGSPASVHDDRPWIGHLLQQLREQHARRMPMLGLCFGHQALATALGGRVAKSAQGLRVGTVTTTLACSAPWMQPAQNAITLYAAHDEQVVQPPPGAQVLGGDADCPVGAYTVGSHVLGLQYHPEFNRAFMDDLLDTVAPKLGPDALARGRAQVAQPVDAPVVWSWVAQFFEQAWGHPAA